MVDQKVQWKHLYEFIQEQIKKDPNFLENQLMIEMVPPEHCAESGGWKRAQDSENWHYVEPAWCFGDHVIVLTTTFPKDKKIVTLNINY